MDTPSIQSPDLGPEFDAPSPTATASPVSPPHDLIPATPEFENSPEPITTPFYPPLQEVWSISTETEECSNSSTSTTIWYEEDACCLSKPAPVEEKCFQDRRRSRLKSPSPCHQVHQILVLCGNTCQKFHGCVQERPPCLSRLAHRSRRSNLDEQIRTPQWARNLLKFLRH